LKGLLSSFREPSNKNKKRTTGKMGRETRGGGARRKGGDLAACRSKQVRKSGPV